jgi:hypothetical protein
MDNPHPQPQTSRRRDNDTWQHIRKLLMLQQKQKNISSQQNLGLGKEEGSK